MAHITDAIVAVMVPRPIVLEYSHGILSSILLIIGDEQLFVCRILESMPDIATVRLHFK